MHGKLNQPKSPQRDTKPMKKFTLLTVVAQYRVPTRETK